jgi:hypothetical protein
MQSAWWMAVALLLPSCAPPPPLAERLSAAIVGGQTAGKGQWPSVIWLPERRCSGVLIHAQLVLTAGHCGQQGTRVLFGEDAVAPDREVGVGQCHEFAADGSQSDWGLCELLTPVMEVPLVPLLDASEAHIVRPGLPVVLVGYGETALGAADTGRKRFVETSVKALDDGNGIRVGGDGRGGCYGDSGGAAFTRLGDGWRVIAIDSAGVSAGCQGGDYMSLVHPARAWIEHQSGLALGPPPVDGEQLPPGCNLGGGPHTRSGERWLGLAMALLVSRLRGCPKRPDRTAPVRLFALAPRRERDRAG